jgi:hypothetical protein
MRTSVAAAGHVLDDLGLLPAEGRIAEDRLQDVQRALLDVAHGITFSLPKLPSRNAP